MRSRTKSRTCVGALALTMAGSALLVSACAEPEAASMSGPRVTASPEPVEAPIGDAPAASEPSSLSAPFSGEPPDLTPEDPTADSEATSFARQRPSGAALATATGGEDLGPFGVEDALDAVALTEEVAVEPALLVSLNSVAAVEGEASLPGEVAGPALRLDVEVRNGTPDTLQLGNALVDLYYGSDRVPGLHLSGPDVSPLSGELASGRSASGRYVVAVPESERARVVITVTLEPGLPTVVFDGPASDAP